MRSVALGSASPIGHMLSLDLLANSDKCSSLQTILDKYETCSHFWSMLLADESILLPQFKLKPTEPQHRSNWMGLDLWSCEQQSEQVCSLWTPSPDSNIHPIR